MRKEIHTYRIRKNHMQIKIYQNLSKNRNDILTKKENEIEHLKLENIRIKKKYINGKHDALSTFSMS